MRKTYKRCSHCGVRYIYQSSGSGCHDFLNNDSWCPDCMQVIEDALSQIPIKRKKDIIHYTDSSLWSHLTDTIEEKIETWEKEEEERTMNNLIRRMSMPLFDVETGRVSSTALLEGLPDIAKGALKCIYFKDPFEINSFSRTVEINALTGEEIGPWLD